MRARLEEEKVPGWPGLCGNWSSVTDCEAADESKGILGPLVFGAWSGLASTEGGLLLLLHDAWYCGPWMEDRTRAMLEAVGAVSADTPS